jgi:glycosidase
LSSQGRLRRLIVREFNRDFQGVVVQLDYLLDLGIKTLELMPVTNVREDVEWGYTPLGYFALDERLGGGTGLKQLVDACHGRGIAVIVDAVYAHAHPEFAFNLVYEATGESNPMIADVEHDRAVDARVPASERSPRTAGPRRRGRRHSPGSPRPSPSPISVAATMNVSDVD